MPDNLIRAEWKELHLRVFIVDCSELTCDLVESHEAEGWAALLYAKALTAGLLTSPLLENDERYTIRWQYEGEVGTITVDVASEGKVRGYPQKVKLESNSFEEIFGASGKVGIVKSNTHRRLNSGMTLADQGDFAKDLSTAFTISDQVPTSIMIDIKTHPWQARAWMIQALPETSFEDFENLRTTLESDEAAEHFAKLESIEPPYIVSLFRGLGITDKNMTLQVHDTLVPESFCECNREKITNVLKGLPLAEIEDMIKVDGGAQVDCQFCNHCYRFEANDLRALIEEK